MQAYHIIINPVHNSTTHFNAISLKPNHSANLWPVDDNDAICFDPKLDDLHGMGR
jgi:hypothetical protein